MAYKERRLHLDWETFSELDIKKVGAYRYAMDPSTELLMGAWAINDGKVKSWDAKRKPTMPAELKRELENPRTTIYAFNAVFERLILKHVLGIDIPIERFRCTQIMAYGRSFAGRLIDVGMQLELPNEHLKLDSGKAFIQRFCKPQPKNHNVRRWTHENDPEGWQSGLEYNVQDVVAEREIYYDLREVPIRQEEWDTWFLDQKINDTGLPVDTDFLHAALNLAAVERERLMGELQRITKLENPNSGKQLLPWFRDQGIRITDLQAATIEDAINRPKAFGAKRNKWPKAIAEALLLKQQLAKTSVSKYEALERAVCPDGRLRGSLQYMGASRTARWAGRIFQPQNLPRPLKGLDTDAVAEAILTMDYDELVATFPQFTVMDMLSSTIRSAIKAQGNKELTVSDLSGIEGRVLPWLCFDEVKLDKIRNGINMYFVASSEIYGIPYEDMNKEIPEYMAGKVAELALGYQGAVGALNQMGSSYGIEFEEDEALRIVKGWRKANKPIVDFWYNTERAAIRAVQNEGKEFQVGRLTFYANEEWLFMRLPNGRELSYFLPDVRNGKLSYMGLNTYTRKWERIKTYGGKLVENATQAVARDVLRDNMHKADEYGFTLIGTVHDEILTENKIAKKYGIAKLNHILAIVPGWADGLPLNAEGYVAKRYRK